MKKYTEIHFSKPNIEVEDWQKLGDAITHYLGFISKWKLFISLDTQLHYYIETNIELPVSFSKIDSFLLKKVQYKPLKTKKRNHSFYNMSDTLIELYYKSKLKKNMKLKQAEIHFFRIFDKVFYFAEFIFERNGRLVKKTALICLPFSMLKIDFRIEKNFQYQQANYLDIKKSLSLLTNNGDNSILEIDTFPYYNEICYLNLSHYDFDKHSLIVGASGTGKSKLMGLIASTFLQNEKLNTQYKIVIIDPHASLKEDIGGLKGVNVIDFETIHTSISLFDGKKEDALATTELYLSLFSSLLNGYNAKLERVLRHSIYLLLYLEAFTFMNMKQLLLDLEYRLNILKQNDIPLSITNFFMGDFNELKNQSYSEAIAPIISFLDEMELVLGITSDKTLKESVENNLVTIFSLDAMKLGTHTIKTIAGFLMQQMLCLAMQNKIEEHIIFMIDEVSTLENPVLSKMLSEMRKYGLSLVLAEQYFDQISNNLKNSIFANVQNYYVFRVSIKDAEELKNHLEMNIEEDKKVKLLSTLKERECVIRLGSRGVLYPALKAKTNFLQSVPYQKRIDEITKKYGLNSSHYTFEIGQPTSILDILKSLSSSRKKVS